MNVAAGVLKKTMQIFAEAQAAVRQLPSNYQANCTAKIAEVAELHKKATNEQKTIYFEKDLSDGELPKPDVQNFVKLEKTLDDLDSKQPIEDKLRHIVPPAVR